MRKKEQFYLDLENYFNYSHITNKKNECCA